MGAVPWAVYLGPVLAFNPRNCPFKLCNPNGDALVKTSLVFFILLSVFSTVTMAAGRASVAQKSCRYLQSKDTLWTPPTTAEWSYAAGGVRSGLVNIYIHATLQNLREALHKAGYTQAKPETAANNAAYVEAAALATALGNHVSAKMLYSIRSMPVSTETMCGSSQLVSFERDNQVFGGRHHMRIFNINRVDESGIPVWAVAALRDSKITLNASQPKTFFLYHAVDPDIDEERDMVLNDLNKVGLIKQQFSIPLMISESRPPNGIVSNDRVAIEVVLDSTMLNLSPNSVRLTRRDSELQPSKTM